MVTCGMGKRIVLMLLIACFCFNLTISSGCKKKDQSEQSRQDVPAETKEVSVFKETEPVDTSEKINLRILYAGLPDTDRAKDFVTFLSAHFAKVETTDYNTFTGNEAANYDVAIIDHNGVAFRPPLPRISRQYTRATVTMGVPGAFICDKLSLKTGYL